MAQAVTSILPSGTEFVCRVFAWDAGIPEDPVTGSMYACLGPLWQGHTGGNSEFKARQLSKRGGDVSVTLLQNGKVVVIGGKAVGVMQGTLFY